MSLVARRTYFSLDIRRRVYVMQRGEEHYEANVRSTIAPNDSSAMLSAGLAGVGIVYTRAFMAAPHLATGALQAVLTEWSAGSTPLFVVYPPHRHVSSRLRIFVDWVAGLVEEQSDRDALSRLRERAGVRAGAHTLTLTLSRKRERERPACLRVPSRTGPVTGLECSAVKKRAWSSSRAPAGKPVLELQGCACRRSVARSSMRRRPITSTWTRPWCCW
ncbi:LysR substrate-binding domain-containing protein [Piscinibacter sp. XHJ-5]|uniref:LysR substrate-binding domain-containing protein n=1 Tax=Piscinibacter sp. XHJ-5 TaxID=3037797 RepID=UPI0024535039|nr:LysR substrate-binding domain-containing protein [Piscinibacter sp. XHJ-5]